MEVLAIKTTLAVITLQKWPCRIVERLEVSHELVTTKKFVGNKFCRFGPSKKTSK